MSKFLWGACAVSVLALAYAGHAGGNPATGQLEIKGTVSPHCTIVTAGSYQPIFISAAPHDYWRNRYGQDYFLPSFRQCERNR